MSEIITVVVDKPITVTHVSRGAVSTPVRRGVGLTAQTSQQVTVRTVEKVAVPVKTQSPTAVNIPGIQGPPGSPGDLTFTVTAGENLGWPTVVAIDAGVAHAADPNAVEDMVLQLAVTTQAAAVGTPIIVATQFSVTESGWSWVPGRIYLSTVGGGITQTVPNDTSAILEVGRAISTTTIEFNVQTALLRAP
jgi:hypothetical protein